MLLLAELQESLAERFDIVTLLELLDVTPEELLEAFQDRIAEKQDYLRSQLEEDDDGQD